MGFYYIWKYRVKPEYRSKFIKEYGPNGEWVKLFSRSKDYINTIFVKEKNTKDEFITIDFWTDYDAYQAFKSKFTKEIEIIDSKCELFTLKEEFFGEFIDID